jgi:hypothetical protein
MARFDPRTYPDRLAFEAHARKLRVAEFDRLSGAATAWLVRRWEGFAGAIAHVGAATGSHSHR